MNPNRLTRTDMPVIPHVEKEQGKVGLALLMWLLGVPGIVVLLYLIFAH